MNPAELAHYVDHTLLKPEATIGDVKSLIDEAATLGVYSVCVSPSFLPIEVPAELKVAAVCGFPSGKHTPDVKAAEAAEAVRNGADEIDMVIDLANAREGLREALEGEIRTVREAAPHPVVLKVIIESAALTDDEIVLACECAEKAGADFVKTSTGFHPAGGATTHAVELMRRTVGDRLGVKASGGIRDWDAAVAMIEAGATRLGLSGTRAVLEGGTSSGY